MSCGARVQSRRSGETVQVALASSDTGLPPSYPFAAEAIRLANTSATIGMYALEK